MDKDKNSKSKSFEDYILSLTIMEIILALIIGIVNKKWFLLIKYIDSG
jgi:hypothetical protein